MRRVTSHLAVEQGCPGAGVEWGGVLHSKASGLRSEAFGPVLPSSVPYFRQIVSERILASVVKSRWFDVGMHSRQ